ncbi:tyrosine-type recombinase/integrase [Methylovorus sp. SPW-M1]|jgi:integrase
MKLPSYLRLSKHRIYIFRRRVPQNLLQWFPSNEIRISTREVSRPMAIMKSRWLSLELDNLFNYLEMPMTTLSPASDNDRLMSLVRAKLLSLKDDRIAELESEAKLNELKRAMLQGRISALSERGPISPKTKKITLKESIELFLHPDEITRRKDKIATVRKNRDSLNLLMEIIGESLPISDLNQSAAVKFANALKTYKTIKPRSENTINGYLSSLSKFSTWLTTYLSEYGHAKVETEGLRHRRKKKASEEREEFHTDEVVTLLQSMDLTAKAKDLSVYWVILIAAYSGMRLEEIAQLDPLNDIREENGIWIFDINQNDGKSLKNLTSIRKIPVHSFLISAGLIDYIDELKAKKVNVMFPNETIRDGRLGKNLGKRANRKIKNTLGPKGAGKSLHCFRHTFATVLKRKNVPEVFTAALLGHNSGNITYTRYGKDYEMTILKENIELVQYLTK